MMIVKSNIEPLCAMLRLRTKSSKCAFIIVLAECSLCIKTSLAHVKDGILDSDDGDIMAPTDYLPPSHLKYAENYFE